MKNVKLLLTVVLFFMFHSLYGQIDTDKLILGAKGKYFHNEKFYLKEEISEVLKLNEEAYRIYEKYETANNIAWTTGAYSLVIGGLSVYIVSEGTFPCFNNGCFLETAAVIGVFSIFATIPVSLAFTIISHRRLKKSIKVFNENVEEWKIGDLQHQLKMGGTPNGVGFVLNF